jgi:hypothetical protein
MNEQFICATVMEALGSDPGAEASLKSVWSMI